MVGSASALRWLGNSSYRVQSMGNATLGIEDETTALTVFNHQNSAGLVLNPRLNRLDLGLIYASEVTDTPNVSKDTKTTLALARPGGEYRGLTFWANDSLAFRAGIEGMQISTVSTPSGGGTEQKLNFAGMGAGAAGAFKTDFGLAVGAALKFLGGAGKPDPLPGTYTKYDTTLYNVDWSVGAAYCLDKLGANNKLTFGLNLSADDDLPTVSTYGISNNDFSSLTTIERPIAGGTFTQKRTSTVTPIKISAEAIFDLGKILSAGILIDDKISETKTKIEQTTPALSTSTEYKSSASNTLGISPIVRANIPLAKGVNLLPGLMYTTYGSGIYEGYSSNGTNSSYKSYSSTTSSGNFQAGLGLQALDKALQVAVQTGVGTSKYESKSYNTAGTQIGSYTSPDTNTLGVGVGAEYWIVNMVAVRAGYNTNTTTVKAVAPATTDQKDTVSTVTCGVGFKHNDLTADLLVKLDTYTEDPAPDPKPTHTGTGVYLGTCIPF